MTRFLLIVDDIKTNREILKKILGDEYTVEEAADGRQALDILRASRHEFSAVLLDLVMPVMDGFETLERIRESVTLRNLPVVVTTGKTDLDYEVRALRLGANDYITKPYNSTVIKQRIANVINLRETAAAVNEMRYDRLTGLYNRSEFIRIAEDMIKSREDGYYTMSCLNIDNFKVINDQYGTARGDAVLKYIADTMHDFVDAYDGIVCRIGADNFAMLVKSEALSVEYISSLHRSLTAPPSLKQLIKIRIGRYTIVDRSLTASAMYDRAALAEASVKGKYDRYIAVYEESMRERLLREQEIVDEMDDALKNGQFEPWFQPQYNHATGALIGAEALVRWNRGGDTSNPVPPGDFIPVFERNGFIYEMDKYIWERVAILIRGWLDDKRVPPPVSVNISRYDLFRDDFFDSITGLVRKYSLPIDLFRLEITESAFTESPEHIITVVKRLLDYGFIVEIDDFGSGYSSLNTLKDVPANVLKLDMKFFGKTGDLQRGGSIIESVVRMAKWLGMTVIAEGVERPSQADFLKSIGCNYVQGFLYQRPMTTADYEALSRETEVETRLITLETVENFDDATFWDSESIDTLIFNSYIGSAVIFEFYNGVFEVLRATEKYTKMIGEIGLSLDDAMKINWGDYLDADSLEAAISSMKSSREKNEEVLNEYRFIGLPGCPNEVYLRSSMRVIASVGERYLVYCMNENITAQRESERSLRDTDEQLRFLNEAAHDLLAQPDVEAGIIDTLRKLLGYFDGNRAYVFEFDFQRDIAINTYEICAEGVESALEILSAVPIQYMTVWIHAFEKQKYYIINDINALDDSREEEKSVLAAQNIESLFAVPLYRDGKLIGFIGIDDPRRTEAQISRLAAFGDYIAILLTRRDLTAKIDSDNASLLALMNDIPGGFVRMRVNEDGSIAPVYFNDGFLSLTSMSREDFTALYKTDAFAGVHPDDVASVRATVDTIFRNGVARSDKYRLINGRGGYVWVMFFGRMTVGDGGEKYLNIFYTDATVQSTSERQQKELLDNLPFGAALFEFDGESFIVRHLNRRYGELVGRNVESSNGESAYDAIFPADREIVSQELSASIGQKRDAVCDIRICGDDGVYRPFGFIGRAQRREDGTYSIYAAYSPISENKMSYQETLRTSLDTVMSSSSDYFFIKNCDLVYICCSRSNAIFLGRESEKEIIGKKDHDFLDKSIADAFTADDRALLESGEPLVDKLEPLTLPDGSLHYCLTSKYPMHDSNGEIIGLYGISRDITASRETDSQLRLLANGIPGGIATYQMSNGRLSMVYFNDGFCRLLGYTREEYRAHCDIDPLGFIFEDDKSVLLSKINALIDDSVPIDCVHRVNIKGGGIKWLNCKATASERGENGITVRVLIIDVTERQESLERLRMSEEENRLAMIDSGCLVCRYIIAERCLIVTPELARRFNMPERLDDIPDATIRRGEIAPECADDYEDFYRRAANGERNGIATYRTLKDGVWTWIEAHFSTVFSDDGKPVSAVVSFIDVTDRLEKEAVYRKWQQSLDEKGADSYTLYRCNISKNAYFDTIDGRLLGYSHSSVELTYDECVREYSDARVYDEDRGHYLAFLKSDTLLAGYYRGKRSDTLEFREKTEQGGYRWLRLSVDLVEYSGSHDIEAYLMYENIDDYKRAELLNIERAQNDPLTGVLNRAAFESKVADIVKTSAKNSQHALLMLDIDGFKLVNDAFGHGAGDQTLSDLAELLKTAVRRGDLVGRLGGDEFVVFLTDIPSDTIAANKAKQICALTRKSFSLEVEITGSVGISIYPRDGVDFETLYKKADSALYYVKGSGKDGHAFYHDDMEDENLKAEKDKTGLSVYSRPKKRRMLIVDDDRLDYELLAGLFKEDFIIEKARDGAAALIRLRHYGTAISVILLDLFMPGMSGFNVLEKIQESSDLRNIPVVVVSGAEDRETSLRAIRSGASDFVTKPVDPDLLRIRVRSAISKAENERLRAQNSFLEFQNSEVSRYKTALQRSGIALIEHDWMANTFIYDSEISDMLIGHFDSRRLWTILLSDLVADTATVKLIQDSEHRLAGNRGALSAELEVWLRTPSNVRHLFKLSIFKLVNVFGLTEKFILTFKDISSERSEE